MRKTRRFTALILSAVMCMHILPAGTAMASGADGVDDSTAIIQEVTEDADDSGVETVIEEQDESDTQVNPEDGSAPDNQVNPEDENDYEEQDDNSDTLTEADGGLNDNSDDNLGDAPDAEEITELGKVYSASLESDDDIKWFKFVPASTKKYSFYSINPDDYSGYVSCDLFDENMELINSDVNNSIAYYISEDLTAGNTYYFSVNFHSYNGWRGGSVEVKFVVTENKDFSAYVAGTDDTDDYISVNLNQSVKLSVDVIGDNLSDISYEWYENRIDDQYLIQGATSDSYILDEVRKTCTYICKINNGAPRSSWVYFYVSVNNNFKVSSQDGDCNFIDNECYCDVRVKPNESKTLTVDVEGDNLEGITFQWADDDYSIISEATGNTYTVNNIEKKTSISCVVTDRYGNKANICFILNVENGFKAYPSDAEDHYSWISYNLKPNEKKTISVTVEADDKEGITYRWYENYRIIEGVTGESFTLEKADKTTYYQCEVTDRYGNKASVDFNVYIDNGFKVYPAEVEDHYSNSITYSLKLNQGKTFSVTVEADDKDGITYRWYDPNSNFIDGASGDSYSLSKATKNGTYYCAVTDRYGNEEYAYFYVIIDNSLNAYPADSEDHDDNSITYTLKPNEEKTFTVSVEANDIEGIKYDWYDSNGRYISRDSTDSYTLKNALKNDCYQCTVTDKFGNYREVYFYVKIDNGLKAYPSDSEYQDNSISYTLKPNEKKTLSVSVEADDTEGITYQWYKYNGMLEIEGATDNTYEINNPFTMSYCCYVTDKYGNQKDAYFYVDVDNGFKAYPSDSDSPYADSISYKLKPNENKNLSVSVEAYDKEGITYKWYNVIDDGDFEISEITTANYTLDKANKTTTYRCDVADKYGNSQSIYFFVYIDNGFKAYASDAKDPTDWSVTYDVKPNESKTISVTVEADDKEGLIYQWYDSSGNIISEALGNSYTARSIKKAGSYRCTVTDKYGNKAEIYFYIRVNHLKAYAADTESKEITVYVYPNEQKTLSIDVTADDMSNVSYHWHAYRYDLSYSETIDDNKNSITTKPLTQKSITYSCIVTDNYGNEERIYFNLEMTNDFRLYVANTADTEARLTANLGDTKKLSVDIVGNHLDGVTYQWYVRNENYSYDPIEGATEASYTANINNNTFWVDGSIQYYCVATDPYGYSQHAYFYIYPATSFNAYVSGGRYTYTTYNLKPGDSKNLAVSVDAEDKTGIVYKWYLYDNEKYDYSLIEGESGDSLQIDSVTTNCRYKCEVTLNGITKSVVFNLAVNHFKVFISGTNNNYQEINVAPGKNQTLAVDVYADDMSAVTYEWTKNGSDNPIENAKGNTLTLNNIEKGDTYYCYVKDGHGNTSSVTFSISVNNLTAYISGTNKDYKKFNLRDNESVILSVDVSADDMNGVTYTWEYENSSEYNYVRLDNDTNKYTAKRNLAYSYEYYRCIVKDAYGNTKYLYFYLENDNRNNLHAYVKNTKDTSKTINAKGNDKIQLSVDVDADDLNGIKYRWEKDYQTVIGESGSTFTTDPLIKNTNYSCAVTDKYGNTSYVYFYIKLNNLKAYVKRTTEIKKTYKVQKGSIVDLAVDISADDKSDIKITWYKQDYTDELSLSYLIEDTNGKTSITTDPVTRKTKYTCKVTDKYHNQATVTFYVEVENGLSAHISGTNEISKTFLVKKGDSITLKADATADNMDSLVYEWRLYDRGSTPLINDAITDTLIIDKVTENKTYRCRITDNYGNQVILVFKVYIRLFDDVTEDKGYCNAVYWALDRGITSGKTETLFDPKGGCTRAQFVTFIWRMAGSPEPDETLSFSDVPVTAGYYKAVMWAAENGITAGYTGKRAGQFGPKDVCTREQCVTFLYRYNSSSGGSSNVTAEDYAKYNFTDVPANAFYYEPITWAAKNGITSGISDTVFGRGRSCTRSQMVSFLQRFSYYRYPYQNPDYFGD